MKNLYKIQDDLYIIDNNEKITQNGIWARCEFTGDILKNRNGQYAYKVILTTNKLLIKDGVQAISDEFLEWFVKNPSCEEIEVEKVSVMNDRFKLGYKIIIPKEEPKQETSFEKAKNFFIKKIDEAIKNSEKEPKTKCYCGHTSYCDCIPLEPKQETLEEAALDYSGYEEHRMDFIAGAKWQKEQDNNKYSDEDVIELLKTFDEKFNSGIVERNKGINNWFEQFKKK